MPGEPLSNGPNPVPPGGPSPIAIPPGSVAMEPTPLELDSAPVCGSPFARSSPLEGAVTRPINDAEGWIRLAVRKALELLAFGALPGGSISGPEANSSCKRA